MVKDPLNIVNIAPRRSLLLGARSLAWLLCTKATVTLGRDSVSPLIILVIVPFLSILPPKNPT